MTGSVGQHGRGLTIKGGLSQYAQNHPRIYLLDGEGQVPLELREVIQLVADAAIILNLGHTSFAEMTAVIGQAKKQGAKRTVCDHPFFLKLALGHLAERGAWINFTAGELLPRWWRISISDFAATIRRVGVERSVCPATAGSFTIRRWSRHCGCVVSCCWKRNSPPTKSGNYCTTTPRRCSTHESRMLYGCPTSERVTVAAPLKVSQSG